MPRELFPTGLHRVPSGPDQAGRRPAEQDEEPLVGILRAMLSAAKTSPGLVALASLSCVCSSYAREADAEIARRLGLKQPELPMPGAGDRWLTPKEAAPMLGTSVQSLNRRWRKLPFCRPGVTRGFRVSLVGLREYMANSCDSDETPTRARGRRPVPRI
jgi:hypothetical protein